MLGQDPVIGDHLGQVYEREGKEKLAARAYELALATGAEYPDARQHLNELTARNPRLAPSVLTPKRPGMPDNFSSGAAAELSAMRTVKLPRLTSKTASAEYFLLFSAGPKVEEVKFISGAEELRNADKALSAARYNLPIPDQGVRIVRRGILMCSQATAECNIVLLPPGSVHSVN